MDYTSKTKLGADGLLSDPIHGNRLETVVARRLYASWPAIFCGLATAMATVWFLSLLGSVIGMSVLDGTDAEAMGTGLGIGAIIWILMTGLVAFLFGGLLTGRVR